LDVVREDSSSNPYIVAVAHSAKRSEPLANDWYFMRVELNSALTSIEGEKFYKGTTGTDPSDYGMPVAMQCYWECSSWSCWPSAYIVFSSVINEEKSWYFKFEPGDSGSHYRVIEHSYPLMRFNAAVFSSSKTTTLAGDIGTVPLAYLVGYAENFECTDATQPNSSTKKVPVIAPLSTSSEAACTQA